MILFILRLNFLLILRFAFRISTVCTFLLPRLLVLSVTASPGGRGSPAPPLTAMDEFDEFNEFRALTGVLRLASSLPTAQLAQPPLPYWQ